MKKRKPKVVLGKLLINVTSKREQFEKKEKEKEKRQENERLILDKIVRSNKAEIELKSPFDQLVTICSLAFEFHRNKDIY